MDEGALNAFIEDRDILTEVQKGMADKRTPNIDLAIDAGALRFRRLVDRRIGEERAALEAS